MPESFKCIFYYIIGATLLFLGIAVPLASQDIAVKLTESKMTPHYSVVTEFNQTYHKGQFFWERGITYTSYITAKLYDTNEVVSFEEEATAAHIYNYPPGTKIIVYEYNGQYRASKRAFFQNDWFAAIAVVFIVVATVFLIKGRALYNSNRY